MTTTNKKSATKQPEAKAPESNAPETKAPETKLPPKVEDATHLKVTAPRKGFRRAGLALAGTQYLALADLAPEQIAALEAEPMLTCERVGEMPDASPGN